MLSQKAWKLETVLILLAALFLSAAIGGLLLQALLKYGLVGYVDKKHLQYVVNTLVFQGSAFALFFWFLRHHHTTWKEAFGLRRDPGRAALYGMGATALFIPLSSGFLILSERILHEFNIATDSQLVVQVVGDESQSLARMIFLGVVTVVSAPLVEEVLFRGILYPTIKQAGFPRLAFFGSAVLFAFIHANARVFLPLMLLALVLNVLYERTGNLLAPFLTHSLFNAVNFVWILYKGAQTE